MFRIIQFTLRWLRSLSYLIYCLLFLFTFLGDSLKSAILDHQIDLILGGALLHMCDRFCFARMATAVSPIPRALLVWRWDSSHWGEGEGLHPFPLILGKSLWLPWRVEYGEMVPYDAMWSFLKQDLKYAMHFCLAFLGCFRLELKHHIVRKPKQPT